MRGIIVNGIFVSYHYYDLCWFCLYRASEIVIPDISHHTFTQLLEYLYTDDVYITMDTAMNLFQVSDTIRYFNLYILLSFICIIIWIISSSIIIIIYHHLSQFYLYPTPLTPLSSLTSLHYLNSFLQAADRFGIDRLKKLCEQEMLSAINLETASYIFYSADRYNAEVSRYLRQWLQHHHHHHHHDMYII